MIISSPVKIGVQEIAAGVAKKSVAVVIRIQGNSNNTDMGDSSWQN